MNVESTKQANLVDLADLDVQLNQNAYRANHLQAQVEVDRLQQKSQQQRKIELDAQVAVEEVEGNIAQSEKDLALVQKRLEHDRQLLDSSATQAKHLTELQHELAGLQRRISVLEDELLELMERKETLVSEHIQAQTQTASVTAALKQASEHVDIEHEELARQREALLQQRHNLAQQVPTELIECYEQQRASTGTGAAKLVGQRCGACQMELARNTMAQIRSASADEVIQCSECGAILVRG